MANQGRVAADMSDLVLRWKWAAPIAWGVWAGAQNFVFGWMQAAASALAQGSATTVSILVLDRCFAGLTRRGILPAIAAVASLGLIVAISVAAHFIAGTQHLLTVLALPTLVGALYMAAKVRS